MSWQTPVTNRTAGSRTTATDMNRIVGNLIEVGMTPTKTSYSAADIVTQTDWNEIIGLIKHADSTIDYTTTHTNFNKIESAISSIHDGTLGVFTIDSHVYCFRAGMTYKEWQLSNFNDGEVVTKVNTGVIHASFNSSANSVAYTTNLSQAQQAKALSQLGGIVTSANSMMTTSSPYNLRKISNCGIAFNSSQSRFYIASISLSNLMNETPIVHGDNLEFCGYTTSGVGNYIRQSANTGNWHPNAKGIGTASSSNTMIRITNRS